MTIENPDVRNFTPQTNYTFYHYDINGKISGPLDHDDQTSAKELLTKNNVAFAMKMEVRSGGHSGVFYYCPFYRQKLLDPAGIDANKRKECEFLKTPQLIFDLYINFLVTKKQTHLIHAERMLVDV